ncbi:MAG: DNA-3-methyladenine glycosylase [Bdellovibrio sp.]
METHKETLLPQAFYLRNTVTVAKSLLGKVLNIKISGKRQRARIVEVEAYLGIKDRAAHTFGDRHTERTKSMYLEGGHTYVYLVYGLYHCINFVARPYGTPEAVLIRAVQPLPANDHPKKTDLKTNGPGKLCKYYKITREHDGVKLWKKSSPLYVTDDGFKIPRSKIAVRPRIGVDYAAEAAPWPLRFYIKNNPFVSKK